MAKSSKNLQRIQIGRLRALLALMAFVREGQSHDELLERTRLAIAEIRATRRALAGRRRRGAAARSEPPIGLLVDYAQADVRTEAGLVGERTTAVRKHLNGRWQSCCFKKPRNRL
jgi:hypothetical protein